MSLNCMLALRIGVMLVPTVSLVYTEMIEIEEHRRSHDMSHNNCQRHIAFSNLEKYQKKAAKHDWICAKSAASRIGFPVTRGLSTQCMTSTKTVVERPYRLSTTLEKAASLADFATEDCDLHTLIAVEVR